MSMSKSNQVLIQLNPPVRVFWKMTTASMFVGKVIITFEISHSM